MAKGPTMAKEVVRLKNYLAQKRLKLTQQRERILEAFLKVDHITAEELHRQISQKKPHRMGLATIYRTLNLLCEIGIGQQRHFDDTRTIYDNVINKRHHDHLICDKCDKIIEFESPAIERLQDEMAARHGFTLSHHRLELYGHCIDWEKCRDWQKTAGR
ncbi:MAG TPA: Fur family transcriptional regulator [Nitrospiria bacterium]|nr:Fur family transcriptional regulator [Nitrospiria bacterium]